MKAKRVIIAKANLHGDREFPKRSFCHHACLMTLPSTTGLMSTADEITKLCQTRVCGQSNTMNLPEHAHAVFEQTARHGLNPRP